MPLTGSSPPEIGDRKVSTTSARDSLQNNLNLSSLDNDRTLKKKKSWFATVRDAVSKSALTAKAAVDALRVDLQPSEETPTENAKTVSTFEPRVSLESTASSIKAQTISSTIPIRPKHERQRSLAAKFTPSSLRQHLHSKRGGVYSINSKPGPDNEEEIAGLKTLSTPPLQAQDDKKHSSLTSSITSSIVGSIRGMGRKQKASKSLTSHAVAVDPPSDELDAPSSPINIPSAAPSLANLDFGVTNLGIYPAAVVGSPNKHEEGFLFQLAKPANNQIARSSDATNSRESKSWEDSVQAIIEHRPVAPRDIFSISFDDQVHDLSLAPGPATPMPGTTFALEVDGVNTEVFERSVTPPNEKERKELRTMRSLDAMAKECATGWKSQTPEIVEANEDRQDEKHASAAGDETDRPAKQPSAPTFPSLQPRPQRRDIASAETVHTMPTDMKELCRQDSAGPLTTNFEPREEEDPFADRHAFGTGPANTGQGFKIRLCTSHVCTDACRSIPSGSDESGNAGSCPTSEGIPSAEESDAIDPDAQYRFSSSALESPVNSMTSLQAQLELQRNYISAEEHVEAEPSDTRRSTSEPGDPFVNLGSDDDTARRAQELLGYDIVIPNYDSPDSGSVDGDENGSPSHGGPLVSTHEENERSAAPAFSPRSTRSNYHAGLGDAQYVFSFDSWLRESSGGISPDQPITPNHRREEMLSLDSISTTEERLTPAISPSTTNPDHHTPSMGNRLEFDLKRSARNMRYNALHQERPTLGATTGPTLRRQGRSFIIGASEENDTASLQFASFENAYKNSRENTPNKSKDSSSTMQNRVGSEESVAESFRNAAYDYSQLAERLGAEPENVFADAVFDTIEAEDDDPFRTHRADIPSPLGKTTRDRVVATGTSRLHRGSHALSTSSVDSWSTVAEKADRTASGDTFDGTLKLFSSPDSGYQADNSSTVQAEGSAEKEKGNGKEVPSRYRQRRLVKGGPMRDISLNF